MMDGFLIGRKRFANSWSNGHKWPEDLALSNPTNEYKQMRQIGPRPMAQIS